jgi:hypothetical protein
VLYDHRTDGRKRDQARAGVADSKVWLSSGDVTTTAGASVSVTE